MDFGTHLLKLKYAYTEEGLNRILRGVTSLLLQKLVSEKYPNISQSDMITSHDLLSLKNCMLLSEFSNKQRNSMIKKGRPDHPFDEIREQEEFLQSCEYSYRSDFACVMKNIRLLGPDGIGINSNGSVLTDSITMPNEKIRCKKAIRNAFTNYPLLTMESLSNFDFLGEYMSSIHRLNHACSLYSAWNNYYHWVIEHLPKIRAINYYYNNTNIDPKIIISQNPPTYVYESLRLLNIGRSDCIEWSPPGVYIDTFLLPAYPEANPSNLYWLRSKFREKTENKDMDISGERIFISRGNAAKRKIRNESEVNKILDAFEFRKIFAENLSFEQQVSIFSNSEIILGVHGAGLTNMLWADSISVVEIHNHCIRDHYYMLANNLGHDYFPVRGQADDNNNKDSDIKVDINRLETVLSKIT